MELLKNDVLLSAEGGHDTIGRRARWRAEEVND